MEEAQIALTAADLAMLAYSLVFLGGVIGGWAFVIGVNQRL
jgi:hypothetical protein